MNITKGSKIVLLASTISLGAALSLIDMSFAEAAPQVKGKSGCIWYNGQRGDAGSPVGCSSAYPDGHSPDRGPDGDQGAAYGKYDSFVTTGEMNSVLNQIYQDFGAGTDLSALERKDREHDGRLDGHDKNINDIHNKDKDQDGRLDGHDKEISDLHDKDKEQDGRLDGHDKDISDLRDKDKEHDSRLDGHDKDITDLRNKDIEQDNRLDGHDKDIAAINDGAVFYNRDQDGNKTGGVTLNDGTGNNVQLGNVAAGIDTKDAVNVDQLNGALAGLGGGASVNNDGTVNAPTYTVGGATYNNVGDALNATNKLGVQYVADENGNPTNTVALIGDGTGKPVSITNLADGVADNDAANYGQVKDRVSYDRNEGGSRSNTITLQGGNSSETVRISNLSDGVASSDAATVGQINRGIQDLRDYTDNRLDALAGHVSDVQNEARGGIASAMAAAGLRYDDRPGKASIAGGLGGFKNAQAIAAGVGYTSEKGRFRLNAAVGHSFQSNDTSWNAGASWTLN